MESFKAIRKEIMVSASLRDVWEAWTTIEGVETFFAPKARIELKMGGAYELYFDEEAKIGSRGSEECVTLSYLPFEMLSFSWNAPPQWEDERKERTFVVVQFQELGDIRTKVKITHLGWKDGGKWDEVFNYFERAWDIVTERLKRRFEFGPINWKEIT
ncbi:MAG: SRPBCC domain-containing protein [Myxococcota bacterium]